MQSKLVKLSNITDLLTMLTTIYITKTFSLHIHVTHAGVEFHLHLLIFLECRFRVFDLDASNTNTFFFLFYKDMLKDAVQKQ